MGKALSLNNKWKCASCGYVYDPDIGNVAHEVAAGTTWEKVPATWKCVECEAGKDAFVQISEREARR